MCIRDRNQNAPGGQNEVAQIRGLFRNYDLVELLPIEKWPPTAPIQNLLSFQFLLKGLSRYEVVVFKLFPKMCTLIGIRSQVHMPIKCAWAVTCQLWVSSALTPCHETVRRKQSDHWKIITFGYLYIFFYVQCTVEKLFLGRFHLFYLIWSNKNHLSAPN